MKNLLDEQELSQLRSLIEGAQNIVLTCHTNPDGDALGALTAMTSILLHRGKNVVPVAPDKWPANINWLPFADRILNYTKKEEEVKAALQKADLIVMLDHGQLGRMAALGDAVKDSDKPRLVIDHHPEPEPATMAICQPTLCAACEVLFRILDQLGWLDDMTLDEATCIYTGMMCDTGGFTFASSRPEVFLIISRLLEIGIDKDRLYRNVFYTASVDRYRLLGYLLYVKMEVMREYNTAIMSFTNEERKRFNIKNGETDGMVNHPLMIDRMRLSVFLREDTERKGVVRVSLRSVDDFPCNEMSAEFFNGGGHRNASGGTIYGTMDEAIELVHKAVRKYADKLRG